MSQARELAANVKDSADSALLEIQKAGTADANNVNLGELDFRNLKKEVHEVSQFFQCVLAKVVTSSGGLFTMPELPDLSSFVPDELQEGRHTKNNRTKAPWISKNNGLFCPLFC